MRLILIQWTIAPEGAGTGAFCTHHPYCLTQKLFFCQSSYKTCILMRKIILQHRCHRFAAVKRLCTTATVSNSIPELADPYFVERRVNIAATCITSRYHTVVQANNRIHFLVICFRRINELFNYTLCIWIECVCRIHIILSCKRCRIDTIDIKECLVESLSNLRTNLRSS